MRLRARPGGGPVGAALQVSLRRHSVAHARRGGNAGRRAPQWRGGRRLPEGPHGRAFGPCRTRG